MFIVPQVSPSESQGGKTERAQPTSFRKVVQSRKQTRLTVSPQSLTWLLMNKAAIKTVHGLVWLYIQ